MQFDPRNYDFSSLLVNAKNIKINPPKFAWYTIIATWFWIGFLPFAQGTFGSLAVYPIYSFIYESAHATAKVSAYKDVLNKFWFWFTIIFVFGWLAVIKYQEVTNTTDHKSVVIDEVLGMLLTFSLCFDWAYFIATKIAHPLGFSYKSMTFLIVFFFFRFYDVVKPFFISTIDRNYKKPLGVILDDLAAGVFATITIFVTYKIVNFIM